MVITSSQSAYQALKFMEDSAVEEVWILTLRLNLELIEKHLVFRGTVDSCMIHPRELLRTVIVANASQFILAHNHPSGDSRPSKADRQMTQKLYKVTKLIEIPMRDHIIIGKNQYFSFADHQLIK